MMVKAILCVQHFCSFGAMLLIVNLLTKTDFTVICVPCMLDHVCYEAFFLNADFEYIEYCLKFTSLKADFLSWQKLLATIFFKRNQSSDNRSHGFGAKFLLKKLSASDFSNERKSALRPDLSK